MKVVAVLIGVVLGLLSMRYIGLEELEVKAWYAFWLVLAQGELLPAQDMLSSTTFWKCVVASVYGGTLAYWISWRMQNTKQCEGGSDE